MFKQPQRNAFAWESKDCYAGVYDDAQRFATDDAGRLVGDRLLCVLITRKDGRQISFTDAGCAGRIGEVSVEGVASGPQNASIDYYEGFLRVCGRALQARYLSEYWKQYRAGGAEQRKTLLLSLDAIGRAYDETFGRAQLKQLLRGLPESKTEKAAAVFGGFSWWAAGR
jgi:hypothetical protein